MPARPAFFKSECLSRTIEIPDLQDLSAKELAALEVELNVAISTMQETMHDRKDDATAEWLYGISFKITICQQFLARVKECGGIKVYQYHLSYFRQAVSNLIGPLHADQLFDKARQQAMIAISKESEG